ncbi:MAG: hypothetical protein ABFD92_20985 [Planctomycetaceae bacterium]
MTAALSALLKAQARLWLLTEQLDPATDPATLERLAADVRQIVAESEGLQAAAEEQPRLFPREWVG